MTDAKRHIEDISIESLEVFSRISLEAKLALQEAQTEYINPYTQTNTLTNTRAVDSLHSNKSVMQKGYQSLVNEPAIARIVAIDERGEKRVVFISRKFSISLEGVEHTSYINNTGMGRLASFDVGDEVNIQMGESSQTYEVLTSMQLRDQPILDKFQDEIFRLPLSTQLLILGPPGTGKTTTLIRRLGQKTILAMSDQEKVNSSNNSLKEEQNWMMFTPTDLLKHFVKEAFNREQVAASNDQIKTWDSYRSELALRALGILQSVSTAGKFIHKKDQSLLKPEVEADPCDWFDAFADFHIRHLSKQLSQGTVILKHLRTDKNTQLVDKINAITSDSSINSIISVYRKLDEIEKDLKPLLKELKAESDKMIRKSLIGIFNKNRNFLKELAELIDTLKIDDDIKGEEEFDDESVGDPITVETSDKKAERAFNQTIRSLSRYKFLKREVPKNSMAYKIANWLGSRIPPDEDLNSIGKNIATQNGLRRFVNASRRFVSDVPSSYREFRKQAFNNNAWYQQKLKNHKYIGSMELDVIILLTLRNARLLLSQSFITRNLDESRYSLLSIISGRFRNQILVDEATDFSPVQLSCMENLTDLKSKSFFACGDFNQRLTSWGIRSQKQMDWVSRKIDTKSINTVYRQSQKLNKFSGRLLEVIGGSLENHGSLPKDMKHTGFSPILIEHCSDIQEKTEWLSKRIKEVIRSVKQMPTIAILVNSKDEVDPIAVALNELLEDVNQNVVACSDQNLGIDNDIRVFEVQYIKGLEFEAVFFVGVDQLALQMEDLFGKYLYVGATRSATYFGMTCDSQLPNDLEPLRELFDENWK